MKKVDLNKAVNLVNRIQNLEARGEAQFSSMNGRDESYIGDNYDGYEGYGQGLQAYDGQDNYAGQGGGRPAQMTAPQRTIKFSLENRTGIAGFTTVAATDVTVEFFGATTNALPGTAALGILKAAPTTLSAVIDGIRYNGLTAANITNTDIVVTGAPAAYRQILAESQSSPYEVFGNKIFCSNQSQLIQDYNTIERDLLGRTLTVPYTPSDKLSAFQFSGTIIEDPEFRLKLDGNQALQYLIYAPGNGGTTAGSTNKVTFSLYLYKITEASRALSGKNTVVQAKTSRMPQGTQNLRIINS